VKNLNADNITSGTLNVSLIDNEFQMGTLEAGESGLEIHYEDDMDHKYWLEAGNAIADEGIVIMDASTRDKSTNYSEMAPSYVNTPKLIAKQVETYAWRIGNYKIYNDLSDATGTIMIQCPTSDYTYAFAVGGSSHSSYSDCPFRVTKYGDVYASNMKVPQMQYGAVNITPSAANTPTGKAVTFSTAFSGAPNVIACPACATPGTRVTGVSTSTTSASSVTIYLTRTDTSVTGIRWHAMY
jgi:hypothetical protein